MVVITLYARQQKSCLYTAVKNRLLGSCGRRQGWDDVREWHSNMYITICETDRKSRFYA